MRLIPDIGDIDPKKLTPSQREELRQLLEKAKSWRQENKIDTFFGDVSDHQNGLYARWEYPKHLEFFEAGARYKERCFMAANRIGKTTVGAYEVALHLTGEYPSWWKGYRFNRATHWWVAGKTNETTRDIVQKALLGNVRADRNRRTVDGTGMIRKSLIDTSRISWKQGVTDLVDTVYVRHATGDWSTLGIKSYQQGRDAFEGTEKDGIWHDEEPPRDIYDESLMRIMTTNGLYMLTFTPLQGLSEVVLQFLSKDIRPDQ